MFFKGSSINDVTVLGGGGQGFCDNSSKSLVIKRVTIGGGGVRNCPKLRDVIYGRPLRVPKRDFSTGVVHNDVMRPKGERGLGFCDYTIYYMSVTIGENLNIVQNGPK